MTDLQHSTREEPNARCNACAIGLSWIENFFYGNRCVLCAKHKRRISLLRLIALVVLDRMIYNALMDVNSPVMPDEGWTEENVPLIYAQVRASLGECGFYDSNQLRTVKDRIVFLRALKRCCKSKKI